MIAPAPAITARASRRAASGGARGAVLFAALGVGACAFRNSLKANYALKNLGFRCAKDRAER